MKDGKDQRLRCSKAFYAGSCLTVNNPLIFPCSQIPAEQIDATLQLVSEVKMIGALFNFVRRQVQNSTYNKGV